MAITQNTYTGDGATVLFSFTFPYLETDDIKVSVNGTLTTAYTLANATTVQFNSAPANGAAIRIYRVTDDDQLAATFYPGSAIRSQDLNENFTQNLYVTQESNRDATQAITTSNSALSTANTALSNSTAAVSTANTAASNAAAAVSTANTANSNASAAVSTANTASSNASAAVSTANSAAADAANALSTANSALSTANTASSNAAAAVSTANTAASNASSAVSTANTAASNASAAVSTANTASSNASSALSTANSALSTANAAASAVANAILYDIVANVAAIPGSPANNDAVEVTDSTGIESFTPLTGVPGGFVGNSGLSVRLVYTTTGNTWTFIQYFPNDPETRYLKVTGGTLTGQLKADDSTSVAAPVIAFDGDTNTGIAHTGADELALITDGTARLTVDPSGSVNVPGSLSVGANAVLDASDIGSTVQGYDADTAKTDVAQTFTAAQTFADNVTLNAQSDLRFADADSSNWVAFQAPATVASNVTWTLPAADGTSGQVLSTDGSGTLSWATAGATDKIEEGNTSAEVIDTGSDGRFVVTTEGTERARVDSSGRLLVGTSSAAQTAGTTSAVQIFRNNLSELLNLHLGFNGALAGARINLSRSRNTTHGSYTILQNGDEIGGISFIGDDGVDYDSLAARIYAEVDGTPGANDMPGRLIFSTTADGASSPTEVMRLTNNKRLFVGTTTSLAGNYLAQFSSSYGGGIWSEATAAGDACYVSRSPGDTLGMHYAGLNNAGTIVYRVNQNGDVRNTNNSYGAISDQKLKENIIDAASQWDDVKAFRVRKYNFKGNDGQSTHTQIGLVAQEVEQISPGLVTETKDYDLEGNDLGTVTKSVNYSVLYMKAVKALQEAMERIETLESEMAAVKAQLA